MLYCLTGCSAKERSITASKKKKISAADIQKYYEVLTGKTTVSKRTWEDWVRVEEGLCDDAYNHMGEVCLHFLFYFNLIFMCVYFGVKHFIKYLYGYNSALTYHMLNS